jgi:hypothetical protein
MKYLKISNDEILEIGTNLDPLLRILIINLKKVFSILSTCPN